MKLILYHGTDYNVATLIESGEFKPQPNPCHWLGNGVYFYFDRALAEWWTTNPTEKYGCRISHPALVKTEFETEVPPRAGVPIHSRSLNGRPPPFL